MSERVVTPEEPVREPAALPAPARGGLEAPLVTLQQAAGNRAVLRLLAGGAPPRRRLQRRRVAAVGEVMDLVFDPATPDSAAHLTGVQLMIRRAWDELSAEDQTAVRTRAMHGLTSAQFAALPAGQQAVWWTHAIRGERPGLEGSDPASVRRGWDRLSNARRDRVRQVAMDGLTVAQFNALPEAKRNQRWAEAIQAVWPGLGLGDPLLIDTGPRPGTADQANIQKLVDNANRIFDTIATGAQTSNLRDVFGAANVARARTKYARARTRMNFLLGQRKIVTDRSGYNREVSLGGLTGSEQLSVSPDTIDHPDDKESVVTVIHEAMHAGNDDVKDKGYINIDANTFKGLAAAVKLTNAAHFEVVPRRILVADFAFAGETFVPAGSGGSPTLTPRQQSIRDASEMFRSAWGLGLNLHMLFVGVVRRPAEWRAFEIRRRLDGVGAGLKWADTLPFWSKVMKLTVHQRAAIDPAAGKVATNPVTAVDIALSEGVVRKLAQGMDAVPPTEAAATTFLTAKASAAELAAASTVALERDLLIKLTLRELLHSITGSTDRDFRMVTLMGTMGDTWADILKRRSPSSFAD
jgi:hypothetical protein